MEEFFMHNRKTIKARPAKRSASTISRTASLREHLSENARQSFCAEGIRYTKTDWDRVEQRLIQKKRLNFSS